MTLLAFALSLGITVLVALAGIIAAREALRREKIRWGHQIIDHTYALPPMQVVEIEPVRYDAAAGERWVREARVAALRIVATNGEVTSDDIWNACPPPDNVDGRLMSNVLSRAEWEITGYRRSARGRNAARQIAVWKLKAAEAA